MKSYKLDYETLGEVITSIEKIVDEIDLFKDTHAEIPSVLEDYLKGSVFKALEDLIEEHTKALEEAYDRLNEILETADEYRDELEEVLIPEMNGFVTLEVDVAKRLANKFGSHVGSNFQTNSVNIDSYIVVNDLKVEQFNDRVATIDYSEYDDYEAGELKQLIIQKSLQIENYEANKKLYFEVQETIEKYNKSLVQSRELKPEILDLLDQIDEIEGQASERLKAAFKFLIKVEKIITGAYLIENAVQGVLKLLENPWLSGLIHTGLTIAGMVPGIGWICDSANAAVYLLEGDYKNAAFSMFSVVPGIGISAVAVQSGKKVDSVSDAMKLMSDVEKAGNGTKLMKGSVAISDGTMVAKEAKSSAKAIENVDSAYKKAKTSKYAIAGTQTSVTVYDDAQWLSQAKYAETLGIDDSTLAAEGFWGSIDHGLTPLKLAII